MGLLKLEDFGLISDLEVNLTNRTYGNTVVKRKGIINMQYNTREQEVVLSVKVKPYAQDVNDTYGQYIGDKPGFKDDFKSISANNNYVVETGFDPAEPDPANPVYPYAAEGGKLLGKASDLIVDAETRTVHESIAGRNVMGEYDFYKFVSETQNVNIATMCKNKVLEDDQKEYDALYPQITP